MMKLMTMMFLITASIVACSVSRAASVPITGNTATVPVGAPTNATITSTQITTSETEDETSIRELVENFGNKLQTVSLLAPDATQEIQKQYSQFVTPALLEEWTRDVSKAPGRVVSSPWPDHIEIITLSKENSNKYVVTGFVVEITSVEVANGGAAAKIPVHMVVGKDQGRWLITEFTEAR